MTEKIKTATPAPTESGRESAECHSIFSQAACARKWQRVLRRLLEGPLHRIDAEKYPVSDHALPSTISELKKRDLEIYAQLVRLPGYGGLGCHVAEYTLAESSRSRALQLLKAGR